MNKSLRTAFFLSLCAALAGCGAKGPLILPEKAAPIEAPAETDAETDVETPVPADDTTTTPADQQAEEAIDDPVPPLEND